MYTAGTLNVYPRVAGSSPAGCKTNNQNDILARIVDENHGCETALSQSLARFSILLAALSARVLITLDIF
jgi:hypothetical protein